MRRPSGPGGSLRAAAPPAATVAVPAAASAADTLALALADQQEGLLNCVHCGFCLPACPTYRRLGDEADSPRGRLYLMQAVVEGRLDAASAAFQEHIGRCLGCRACEPACPSGVEYGRLLELARHVGGEARRPGLATRLLLRVVGTRWLARPAMAAARLLRATGAPALVASAKFVPGRRGRLAAAMLASSARGRLPVGETAAAEATTGPRVRPAAAGSAVGAGLRADRPSSDRPPTAPSGRPPTVAVLDGCVQAGLFARVNKATVRVLETNGYRVAPAPGQGCCGALHAHAGDLRAARALARRNVEAFRKAGTDYVAMNASGCGAAMASYGELLARDPELAGPAAEVAAKVRDVSQLTAERGPVAGAPVAAKVACDEPCHLLHAQGLPRSAERILRAVPDLDVVPLANAAECCGGAGIYGLAQPELGGRIGGDKVDAVLESGAQALATGNPGCMMQIGAELRLRGCRLPVLHPVEILDESYRRAGMYKHVRPEPVNAAGAKA